MSQILHRASFATISTFAGVRDSLPSLNDAKSNQQIRLKGSGQGAQIYVKEPRAVPSARAVTGSAARYQANAVKALGSLFVRDLTQTLGVSQGRAQTIFGAAAPRREQILVGQYRALLQARTTIEVLSKIEGVPVEQAAKLVNDAIRMGVDLQGVTDQQLKAAAAIIKHRPGTPLSQAVRLVPWVQKAQAALSLNRAGALVGELITAGKDIQVTHQHLGNASAYLQAVKSLPADVAVQIAMKYEARLLKLAQGSKHPDVVVQLFKELANRPVTDGMSFVRGAHDAMAQCSQLTASAALDHAEDSGKWFGKLLVKHNLSFAQVEQLLAAAKAPSGDFSAVKVEEAAALVAAHPAMSPASVLSALRHPAYEGFKLSLKGDTKRAMDLVGVLNQLGVKPDAIAQDPATRGWVSRVLTKLENDPALSAEKAGVTTRFPGALPPRGHKVLARSPQVESKSQGASPASASHPHDLSPQQVTRLHIAPKSAPNTAPHSIKPW